MRNRAKCKLCQEIIESKHRHDYVTCSCSEISIDGGDSYLRCCARNWDNFLRVDDDDNELPIEVHNKEETVERKESPLVETKPSRADLISMIDEMVANVERLPNQAMLTPITHYDYMSLLLLLSSIFKAEDREAD